MAENTTNTSNDEHFFGEKEFKGIQEVLRESLLTDPSGGFYMVDEISNSVHNGVAFSISSTGSINGSSSLYLLGRTGANEVHFDQFHMNASNGLFQIDLYEAPTVTADGTPIVPLNRKRSSANTPTMSVFGGTTVSANGTLMENATIYGTGGTGANVRQGNGIFDADWVLAPNTEYLFVITNNDTSAINYSAHFIWAERDVI